MLTVSLAVNGEPIGEMRIINRGAPSDKFPEYTNDLRVYECIGPDQVSRWCLHKRGDGAWELLRKALAAEA